MYIYDDKTDMVTIEDLDKFYDHGMMKILWDARCPNQKKHLTVLFLNQTKPILKITSPRTLISSGLTSNEGNVLLNADK